MLPLRRSAGGRSIRSRFASGSTAVLEGAVWHLVPLPFGWPRRRRCPPHGRLAPPRAEASAIRWAMAEAWCVVSKLRPSAERTAPRASEFQANQIRAAGWTFVHRRTGQGQGVSHLRNGRVWKKVISTPQPTTPFRCCCRRPVSAGERACHDRPKCHHRAFCSPPPLSARILSA